MADPSQLVGQILGHYRILEQIGAGGMGVVYRAHDERLDRDIALKVLPSGALADEAARKRFRKEALALSRLNHPNIAMIFDFDTQDGMDFLVTEYIPGTTLDASVGPGFLPEKQVVRLGLQLAEGLAAAHEQGVVHRDLKPSNLRVSPDGRLKILDFGIAKLLPTGEGAATETLTEAQGVTGTLPYMAPEQLRGEQPDSRTDIYAAGAVLYEMATGRRPFEQRLSTALVNDIINKPPAPPRQVHPKLSPKLEDIVLKCLEKEHENRYQSAKELGIDLRRLQSPSTAPEPALKVRSQFRLVITLSGVAVVSLVALLFALNVGRWRDRLLRRGSPGGIESLAVLPLENLSHDAEQDYFADGMTDELITNLSKISSLRVISRTSVMHYKASRKTIPEIVGELHVDAVVEGTVTRSGNRVRITAQLIQAPTDRHLWAESYERELKDTLALQGEVARDIASEIQARVTPQEQARLRNEHSVNPEAYEAYLKGRYYWAKFTEKDVKKATEYFQQAIDKDPHYALAYAGLADCYTYPGATILSVGLPPREAMAKARAAATKALQMDDTLAEAHASLAGVLFDEWDWVGTEREFKRAIQLNPNYAWAHYEYAGDYLILVGRTQEAIEEMKRARELDPLTVDINQALGWTFYIARQYDKAIEQTRKTLDMDPNYVYTHLWLGLTYEKKSMLKEAISEFQRAVTLTQQSPQMTLLLAQAYALSGNRTQAQKLFKVSMEASKERYASPLWIALTDASLGQKDEAFKWLEKAYQERSDGVPYLAVDPMWDPLRSDPRFQDLVRRVGLPQ